MIVLLSVVFLAASVILVSVDNSTDLDQQKDFYLFIESFISLSSTYLPCTQYECVSRQN